ncbi:MAG: M23 family metallopeptidase [Caldisericia bacterium]|jgi:murein DD-endopeptidase MepM/ murein hydrolase activator NlpD|nr:M23 family metallopeptidase [Caldisericia bacterium]
MATKKKDKEISIIIVPNARGKVKILKIKNSYVYFLISILVVSLISLSYFFVDYSNLKNSLNILSSKNLYTLSEVKDKQIEALDKKVTEQSAKIDAYIDYISYLSSLEVDIRKMAMIPGVPVNINDLIEEKRKDYSYTIESLAAKVQENETKFKALDSQAKNVETNLIVLREATKEYNNIIEHTPNIWPVVGPIMSDYGWRNHPIYRNLEFHKGIDIDAVEGTPIRVTASGVVTKVGWNGGYGLMVEVFHREGVSTVYAHLSKILVSVGQEVKKGEIIGNVGMTGVATDPHVHYEVRINGSPVDPSTYLPGLENR